MLTSYCPCHGHVANHDHELDRCSSREAWSDDRNKGIDRFVDFLFCFLHVVLWMVRYNVYVCVCLYLAWRYAYFRNQHVVCLFIFSSLGKFFFQFHFVAV